MNYWQLTLRGGDVISVKPDMVDTVRRKMDAGELIHTVTRSIPINEIKSFEETDTPFVDERRAMIEGAAQAFREPLVDETGAIEIKWVKKNIPMKTYMRHYSSIPSYRKLADDGNHIIVAFKLATHDIDYSLVTDCTDEEIKQLEGSA